jgi:hypothetical protein
MSNRNEQRQPGGTGAAKTEDLIALAGQQEPTVPAVTTQETKPKGMVKENTTRPQEVIDHFNWEDPEHVVVWEQPRTAVYFNQRGQTIIKQMADNYGDDDPFLMFNRASLPDLIRKLAEQIDAETGNSTVWYDVHNALHGNGL